MSNSDLSLLLTNFDDWERYASGKLGSPACPIKIYVTAPCPVLHGVWPQLNNEVFSVRTNIQATLVMSITRIITSPSITHYHHIPFQQRKQRWFPVPDKCLRSTLSTLTMKQSSQMQEQRTLQKTEYWQGCDCVRHRPGWSWRLVWWLWWQQDDIWTMNAVNSRVLQFRNQYSLTLRKGTEANVCPEFYFFPDCPFFSKILTVSMENTCKCK